MVQLVLEREFALRIIRIKFKKDESVKFISHLDMMKAFQRAVRRAGLAAEYSHGFNPQMQMIFGAPLSLGFTSDSEYADFSFSIDYEPAYVFEALNIALPQGLPVLDSGVRSINKNIMADIAYAGYEFDVKSDIAVVKLADIIMESESLPVEKNRKGRVKTVDVRTMIVESAESSGKLKILVKAGNDQNLNPRLFTEALKLHIDPSIEGSGYNRTEQFVERGGCMVSPLSKEALETK